MQGPGRLHAAPGRAAERLLRRALRSHLLTSGHRWNRRAHARASDTVWSDDGKAALERTLVMVLSGMIALLAGYTLLFASRGCWRRWYIQTCAECPCARASCGKSTEHWEQRSTERHHAQLHSDTAVARIALRYRLDLPLDKLPARMLVARAAGGVRERSGSAPIDTACSKPFECAAAPKPNSTIPCTTTCKTQGHKNLLRAAMYRQLSHFRVDMEFVLNFEPLPAIARSFRAWARTLVSWRLISRNACRMRILRLRYCGREQELLVPEGLPRQDLVKDVCRALELPADADVAFQSGGRRVALTALLPDGFTVDVVSIVAASPGAHQVKAGSHSPLP
jgi:hypothetical protein